MIAVWLITHRLRPSFAEPPAVLLNAQIDLRQWIWRAFAQSALIPLLLVETALVILYFLSNSSIRETQIDHLRDSAIVELEYAAAVEGRVVGEQLAKFGGLTELYRNLTTQALQQPALTPVRNLALSADGVRYSPRDEGGAAVFYPNSTAPAEHDLAKVARLARLDPLMQQIKTQTPLVAALYFNSWDSLNHIYPWFLTLDQYPHDMVIPDYNFYYLADAKHNPQRQVVWTDVYLDPAGQGWMASAIAPVYRGDFLEGVVGIDITVDGVLKKINKLQIPWNGYAMLVSKDLNIMALPKAGEDDFGLNELTQHTYADAIRRELFKPEDFNLRKRAETQALAARMATEASGIERLELGGQAHLVAWASITPTNWHLLTVVAEADVFAQTNSLAEHYKEIGYLLIAGLLLFYAVFFSFMWVRAQQLTNQLRQPITGISRMLREIGRGNRRPERVVSRIGELHEMSSHSVDLGAQLQRSDIQVAAAQQRLELVLECTTESLWELRCDTLSLRGRFVERFGLQGSEISVEAFFQRVHPDDVTLMKAALQLINELGNDRYESEFRFTDEAGHYHWLLSRGRVLERDAQTGNVLMLAGTHVDINTLKQTEADLRQASQEALAASQAKSRFMASITHELRTPLNAISGFAQLLRLEHPVDSASSEADYLDEILLASTHLNQLIGDVLDWSSVQAEKPLLKLQQVDVGQLMNECADMVRLEVLTQGLQLNLDLPEQALRVPADPRRLRQVLINLLSNAIKYNTAYGHITLSYQVAAGHIRLLVEDTGLGISADLQAQLFEPFQRLGQENTAIPGTGIGLSLCREFASQMRGQMGVHSAPGIGSCFWIELPLLAAATLTEISVDEATEALVAGPRVRSQVFYVEDNPASQFLVRLALSDLVEVRVASNGRVALEQILATPPDLLLLDFNLPDMDGEAVLHALRSHAQTRGLPVVMLAAAGEAARLARLDCQGLLAKPINLNELRGLVCALLPEVSCDAV
jgi:signal transduction histidine kinase